MQVPFVDRYLGYSWLKWGIGWVHSSGDPNRIGDGGAFPHCEGDKAMVACPWSAGTSQQDTKMGQGGRGDLGEP